MKNLLYFQFFRSLASRRGTALSALAFFAAVGTAYSHAGHDDASGTDGATGTGPVAITAEARQNLGLQTVEAESQTLEKTLAVLGQIQIIPDHAAAVSSRIAGRVTQLPVNEGQRVKKGPMVAEVESFQVGNPPPRAQYTSPLDGIVLTREVLVGANADPNAKLLTVADLSEVYAEARVFEGQVAQVQPGQKVRVRSEGRPGEVFEGTIERLSGALDPETRTLKVWARIANPEFKLRPNMQATATIVTAQADSVTAVPKAAVLGEGGNLFVFVERPSEHAESGKETPAAAMSTYERRAVVTGVEDDRFIEIIEGVLPGDKVVTVGGYQLQYVAAPKPAAGASHQDGGPKRGNEKPGDLPTTRSSLVQPTVLVYGLGGALALALVACAVLAARLRRANAGTPVGTKTAQKIREEAVSHA